MLAKGFFTNEQNSKGWIKFQKHWSNVSVVWVVPNNYQLLHYVCFICLFIHLAFLPFNSGHLFIIYLTFSDFHKC